MAEPFAAQARELEADQQETVSLRDRLTEAEATAAQAKEDLARELRRSADAELTARALKARIVEIDKRAGDLRKEIDRAHEKSAAALQREAAMLAEMTALRSDSRDSMKTGGGAVDDDLRAPGSNPRSKPL